MQLSFKQIKSITLGAVRVEEKSDGFHFYRFTQKQEEFYKGRNEDFYNKTFATSGIQLRFKTNSKSLKLKISVIASASRRYFALEVFKDGQKINDIKNFSEETMPEDYIPYPFEIGEFEKETELGDGEKEIKIILPWSMQTVIKEICLDDEATLLPVKPKLKLLAFGDSITHGYDALYPSGKYITQLAEYLDAEEYNKAIGGEVFWPELSATREDFVPDIVTVAYGTNDWSKRLRQDFISDCKNFYKNLCENYKTSKIYAITPIWRKDFEDARQVGEFSFVEETIRQATAGYNNVTVISGFDFVPQDENLYADKYLHPNDKGFKYYAENLIKKI